VSRRMRHPQGAETICFRFRSDRRLLSCCCLQRTRLFLLALFVVRQEDQSEGRQTGRELQKQNGATEKQISMEEEAANARPCYRLALSEDVWQGRSEDGSEA
jgi:hypothetical protein